MRPKGKLLIIGGAEDKGEEKLDMENKNIKFRRYEILRELMSFSKKLPIEFITSGSRVPNEVRRSYEKAFERIGYRNLGFMQIHDRSEAKEKSFLRRAEQAGSVFFAGGDQCRIYKILGGTKIIDLIKHRYFNDPDFLLAGTSAGAMAISDVMIPQGTTQEAIVGYDIQLAKGLNIINNCIIDTHFIKRARFGRLVHAILLRENHLGIGLGEDTALIIKNGWDAECRGSGMVVIIDPSNIRNTNIQSIRKGEPIFVENLKVNLLVKGCRFSLKTRRLLPSQ